MFSLQHLNKLMDSGVEQFGTFCIFMVVMGEDFNTCSLDNICFSPVLLRVLRSGYIKQAWALSPGFNIHMHLCRHSCGFVKPLRFALMLTQQNFIVRSVNSSERPSTFAGYKPHLYGLVNPISVFNGPPASSSGTQLSNPFSINVNGIKV